MIYGYARVSTKGQDKYGNGLEVQKEQLIANGVAEENIYCDAFTGTKVDRPRLSELLSTVRDGDTVVVTKLDRIARSTQAGLDIIDMLVGAGVSINILNMGKFDSSPTGKLMRTVFLAFAEFERDMIVQRTSEGKERKRNTDPAWHEGRREKVIDWNVVKRQRDGDMTVEEACSELGISRRTWYNKVHMKGGIQYGND